MASSRARKVNLAAMNTSVSVRLNSGHQDHLECMSVVAKVFNEVQADENNLHGRQLEKFQEKMLEKLFAIYTKVGKVVFAQTLMRLMVVPFQQKDSNPYVRRVVDFFYLLLAWDRWKEGEGSPMKVSPDESFMSVASNATLNSTFGEEDGSGALPMLILKQCEKYSNESRLQIRLRIMQTVAKIIPDIVSISEMGKRFRQKCVRMLFTRSRDKSDQIRALSVKILSSFMGEHLPFQTQIGDIVVDRMAFDPSATVRAEAVSSIKVSDDVIEHIIERAGDPFPTVRAAALNRITSSISLYGLTLEMREAILEFNANGENPKSIQKAMNNLLRNWLEFLKGDPTELLRVLNARKRVKLCRKTLDLLYNQEPEEAFEKIATPVLKGEKYPDDSLCVEITFIWLYMHERFNKEPYIMKKLALSVDEMIEYITEYIDVIEEEEGLSVDDLEYRGWMLGDLLNILCFLPVEEAERLAIIRFLPDLYSKKKLMDVRNSSLAIKLIKICADINDETHLINVVNSILDSERISSSRSRLITPRQNDNENEVRDVHDLKVEMAVLRHQSKKLEQSRDVAVKMGDMYKAQECQDQIDKMEKNIIELREKIDAVDEGLNSTISSETQEDQEERWIFSDETMLMTISMVKTNILQVGHVSDFSRTFYEMYVTKAVVHCRSAEVRAQALELMCIVALSIESECAKAAGYSLVGLIRDKEVVKITALKCLYDLVLRYSFAKLGEYPGVKGILMGQQAEKLSLGNDNPNLLKSFLLSYVNSNNQRLVKVSVAGILKLLFKKELTKSSKLISELIRKWAIPMHDLKVRFKDVEVMIRMYATIGESEAIEVAKCLVTCIRKTIMEIRSKSEFTDDTPHPDIDQITSLILKATEPSRLVEFEFLRPYIGHEAIAESALTELRKMDLSNEERIHYVKLLKLLNLQQCPKESLSRLKHTTQELIAEAYTRQISTLLTGFSHYIDSLALGNDDDIEDAHRDAFEDDE